MDTNNEWQDPKIEPQLGRRVIVKIKDLVNPIEAIFQIPAFKSNAIYMEYDRRNGASNEIDLKKIIRWKYHPDSKEQK